jgi:holo-[acyl-carrier protein] synthase
MRVGCDLVLVARIAKNAENDHFLKRVFHAEELAYCQGRPNRAESLAARFAAKEAFSKALGTGIFAEGVAPTDIWVRNNESGRPQLELAPHVRAMLEAMSLQTCDVSLSHQGDYAMAVVILG